MRRRKIVLNAKRKSRAERAESTVDSGARTCCRIGSRFTLEECMALGQVKKK